MTIKEELDQIQEDLYDIVSEKFHLRYTEEGYIESIHLVIYAYEMNIEIYLWNSDNEEREWIEEINDYEPLKVFIKRRVGQAISVLKELKTLL